MEEPIKNGDKVRKILFNEVSLMTGIVAMAISITFWISNPIRAIEAGDIKIKGDIVALEAKVNEIKSDVGISLTKLQVQLDRVEGRQIEVLQALARLEANH